MVRGFLLFVCITANFVIPGWTWDVLSNMGSRRQESKPYIFKNEYIFGDCKNKNNKLYEHMHKTVDDVQKAAIIREWLYYTTRLPKCVILRASSYESDTYRITRYNLEICVARVSFCYIRERHLYFFYEWYIPEDIVGGMEWDIYFYGPSGVDWKESFA